MLAERDLLISVYKTFNARDIDSTLAAMHPAVDWPNGMEGGRVNGQDGVRAYWTRQWTMVDPHVEPVNFETADDGRIIVHVHQVVRDLSGNVILDQMVQHIYSIDDGLIKSMEIQNV